MTSNHELQGDRGDQCATLEEDDDELEDRSSSHGHDSELSIAPPILRRAVTLPHPGSHRVSFTKLTSGFTRSASLPPQSEIMTQLDPTDGEQPTNPQILQATRTGQASTLNSIPKGAIFAGINSRRTGSSLDDNILRQSALKRSNTRSAYRHTIGPVRAISSTIGFAMRTSVSRAILTTPSAAASAQEVQDQDKARATYRRYRVGDFVLVANALAKGSNPVNRYGFPAGGGITIEETRGPYTFVLATVKKVHFEEDAEYYTVTTADIGTDQRADAELMEPLKTARGEAAALRAAKETDPIVNIAERGLSTGGTNTTSHSNLKQSYKFYEVARKYISMCVSPFLWIYDSCFELVLGERFLQCFHLATLAGKQQGQLFLNGVKPYACSVRLTAVNLLVLCSTWYMFIDQARLAFLPRGADESLAIVSFTVWSILVLELAFEVFIRPDGYHSLIISERAYSPLTVRYINAFHLTIEIISLGVFVPEFLCLMSSRYGCSDRPTFSYFNAVFLAILGPSRIDAFLGRAFFALIRLRVFGLVRHWKKMWINNTFVNRSWSVQESGGLLSGVFAPARVGHLEGSLLSETSALEQKERKEDALINASNIGTALMVTNSHRALMIICAIMGIFPIIEVLNGPNRVSHAMVGQLQAINLEFNNETDAEECRYFFDSIFDWIIGVTGSRKLTLHTDSSIFLLFVSINPSRCNNTFPGGSDGVVPATFCRLFDEGYYIPPSGFQETIEEHCNVWRGITMNTSIKELADRVGIRSGDVNVVVNRTTGVLITENGTIDDIPFTVLAKFNQTYSTEPAALVSFLLQFSLLVFVIVGLSTLRRDAGLLVLGPLRRMLKIVARYAKNPLSEVKTGGVDSDEENSEDSSPEHKLGNYETEQLINAVSKITALLRKCWGVAGAHIISTNLSTQGGALTEVFNPTVPGKSVYALFGFAAINGFDHTLRQLGGDVMILINDVAAVLHGEVFRWGFGDSGQCNKNLGAAFLMVFRIGLVKEVIQKLEQATDVVFSNFATRKNAGRVRKRPIQSRTRKSADSATSNVKDAQKDTRERRRLNQRTNSSRAAMSLSLQSLPGIQTFTDRAVIGMLKSYAGIYRDGKLLNWKNDFRLGAGVGAFSVNMIFGMDAGWAVEGAVGSEYKIDATYLSPHVNMASRMMSACKQYGVSILLSQAVQELMSDIARSKLRQLDTVTVKGSSLKQRIYTYDARHKGVDFFLFGRSDEQADVDSDRYSPNVWNTDQDLRAMRQHVTEDFEFEFNRGRDAYLSGDWTKALKILEGANEIMVETVMNQGYIQDELNELQNRVSEGDDVRAAENELRTETGDGPCRRLIAYMESEGGVPPESWKGYRPLTSK